MTIKLPTLKGQEDQSSNHDQNFTTGMYFPPKLHQKLSKYLISKMNHK